MDNSSSQKAMLDKIAVALSGLCLLHCLALPLIVAVLPFIGQFGEDHFHAQMLLFVVPVSVIALAAGFRRHHQAGLVYLGIFGLLVLVVGGTYVHDEFGAGADQAMTVLGSLILAITHYGNFRLARRDLELIS